MRVVDAAIGAAESAESYHKSMLYRQLNPAPEYVCGYTAGSFKSTEISLVDSLAAGSRRYHSICALDRPDHT